MSKNPNCCTELYGGTGSPEEKDTYCEDCGRAKKVVVKKYDFCRKCGHQLYCHYYECPRKSGFFSAFTLDAHDYDLLKVTCKEDFHGVVVLSE